jgi:hypothetical protein
MEGELWTRVYQFVRRLDSGQRQKRQQFSDRDVLMVYLWAVLHDRPVLWACQAENWPQTRHSWNLPSPSTMSRRIEQNPSGV